MMPALLQHSRHRRLPWSPENGSWPNRSFFRLFGQVFHAYAGGVGKEMKSGAVMRKAATSATFLFLTCSVGLTHAPTVRAQENGIVAGTLTCAGRGNIGLIVGSRQSLSCVFDPVGNAPRQRYSGRITRLGLDLGIKGRSQMVWTVLGPTDGLAPGALQGNFGGVGANASVGVGAGANALVGGSRNTIVLQPLSVQAQTGLNVAAGVAGLRLTYVGP